jgi:hypothetical protein
MIELLITLAFVGLLFLYMWAADAHAAYRISSVSPFDSTGNKVAKAFFECDTTVSDIDPRTYSHILMFTYNRQNVHFSSTTGHLYLSSRRYPMGNRQSTYKLSGANRRKFDNFLHSQGATAKIKLANPAGE